MSSYMGFTQKTQNNTIILDLNKVGLKDLLLSQQLQIHFKPSIKNRKIQTCVKQTIKSVLIYNDDTTLLMLIPEKIKK